MGGQVSTPTGPAAAKTATAAPPVAGKPPQLAASGGVPPAVPAVPAAAGQGPATAQARHGSSEALDAVPTVFKWEHGGHKVYLSGTFNNWARKIPMHRSGNDFTFIMTLPRGAYAYKFIVDDEWRFAPEQSTASDETGNVNNFIDLSAFKQDEFLVKSRSILLNWDAPRGLPSRRRKGSGRRRRAKRRLGDSDGAGGEASDADLEDGSFASEDSDSDSDSDAQLPAADASAPVSVAGSQGALGVPAPGTHAGGAGRRRRRRDTALGLAERVPIYDPDHPGDFSSESEDDNGDEYGCAVPSEDKYSKDPPGMPAHLRAINLNADFTATPTGHKLLPMPGHVTVGHLYCTATKGDLVVQGVTTRYKRKFTTMVFYSPPAVRAEPIIAAAAGDTATAAQLAGRQTAGIVPGASGPSDAGTVAASGSVGTGSPAAAAHVTPAAQSGASAPPVPLPAGSSADTSSTQVVVQTTSGPITVTLTPAHRTAIEEHRATAQQRLTAHATALRAEVAEGRMSQADAETLAAQAQQQAMHWLTEAQNQVLQAALIAQYNAQAPAPGGAQAPAQE